MAASSFVRVFVLLLSWAWFLQAHDVISTKITWTQEISRIVYGHCSGCHRDGGSAPMPLLTYTQVRPWAQAIKEEVHERLMPPWGAVKGFGEFIGDNSLNAEEIHLIADWVEGGAPEGDAQYLPAVPRSGISPAPAPSGRLLADGERLKSPLRLGSIAPPPGLAKGASLQVSAVLPNGATVPLLWIYNFQPKHARAFAYRQPVRLPAGTVIRVSGAGKVRLSARTTP